MQQSPIKRADTNTSYNVFIDDDQDLPDEPIDIIAIEDEPALSGTARFIPLKNIVSPLRDGSNQGGITANSSERPSNPHRF